MKNYDAAIFDMDGTLLDTMRYWRYTSLEYALAHNIPFTDEDLTAMLFSSSRRLLPKLMTRAGISVPPLLEMVRELEGYMNRHYLYDARLKDENVPQLLSALREKGLRLCVATGSPREYARNGLSRLNLLDSFEFVTDTYEFGMGKERPEYFTRVARRLGTTPQRCLVFEDAHYAIEAAKAAGCTVIAIEDITAAPQREAIRKLADRYILSYSELLKEDFYE